MKNLYVVIILTFVVIFWGSFCQNLSGPSPINLPDTVLSKKIPISATINSATLYLYCRHANEEKINIYRIPSEWDEMEVTWNNFDNSKDTVVISSFKTKDVGWVAIDITEMVLSWIENDYPNHGILLDQVKISNENNYSLFSSKESNQDVPYFTINYDLNDNEDETYLIRENITSDAYIWDIDGNRNNNTGSSDRLYTGSVARSQNIGEKQSLLKFSIKED